ncbi:MAG: CotH kinase family protein [Crocinitomicaceae bacterium]|nr:CotH kinase family protein [Crocinitomicaceae bacterium]
MTTIADAFGENKDWVELYNTSSSPADISGFYLSDKPGNPLKWQVPTGTIIPANGYKIIFCSKRNTTSGTEIHTNFSLTQTKGEWIILSNTLGNIVSSLQIIHYTKQDHSVGRSVDGATDWKLFTTPTPNSPNIGAVNFYEPTPVMSLAPGFYSGTQSVTITCSNTSATIRYTIDGSRPNATSPIYSTPLSITSTTVVRAAAFGSEEPSFVATNSYFIDVTHQVCVISVSGTDVYDLIENGNSGPFSNPTQYQGAFELFEEDGTFVDNGEGHFDKHGNDSWSYPQRGFDYIMRDQFGYNSDIEHRIFPEKSREEFQRVILKPAASDNYPFETGGAHIRDAFIHTLSIHAKMKLDERTWRPCVVYLNGEYWGVYEIREKADDHDYTDYYYDQDKYDLQYLKRWGTLDEDYGAPNAQVDWQNLVAYVDGNSMAPGPEFDNVDSLLNWKSMCDYFVFNSYVVNQDWLNWNTAWWRGMDPDGDKKKWRYVLWDMDATFGHYINFTGIPDPSANADPCNVENLPNPGGDGHTDVLQKLINENPLVEQYYITRYIDLVNTYFSCDYMSSLLDSMLNEITPEMPDQIARWGGTMTEWNDNVQALRDFIDLRCTALEQGLIDCYDLTGPHEVTFNVSPAGAGEIKVNSIWMNSFPWSTTYFGGIATNTIAKGYPGYEFDHWEVTTGPMLSPVIEDTNSIMIEQPETVTAVFKLVGETSTTSNGIHVPTGFSPNGDGQNDVFSIIVGQDVNNFTFYIYDRWGNKMVSSSDPAIQWDGNFNGKKVNSGVYAYMYEVNFNNGLSETHEGNITVIR